MNNKTNKVRLWPHLLLAPLAARLLLGLGLLLCWEGTAQHSMDSMHHTSSDSHCLSAHSLPLQTNAGAK